MEKEKELKYGSILQLLIQLDCEKITTTKLMMAFLAIAGMPGIDGQGLSQICGTNYPRGYAFGSILVKRGLVQAIDIPKAGAVRGRRRAGFHLTEKGESLIK